MPVGATGTGRNVSTSPAASCDGAVETENGVPPICAIVVDVPLASSGPMVRQPLANDWGETAAHAEPFHQKARSGPARPQSWIVTL